MAVRSKICITNRASLPFVADFSNNNRIEAVHKPTEPKAPYSVDEPIVKTKEQVRVHARIGIPIVFCIPLGSLSDRSAVRSRVSV